MKKTAWWTTDWFMSGVLALLLLASINTDLMQSLERKAYDWGVMFSSRSPSDRIAVIAIDDASIANLGRWPWPRELQGQLLDVLSKGRPKVVGHTALFFEPQVDGGLEYITRIGELLANSALKKTSPDEWGKLNAIVQEALAHNDNDAKLAESIKRANNILLGMYFTLATPQGNPDQPLPGYVQRNALKMGSESEIKWQVQESSGIQMPIPILGEAARAIGHLSVQQEVDGGVRTEPLVVDYFGQYYPSLSTLLAAQALNVNPRDIQVVAGAGLRIGDLRIATDDALRMNTYFYRDRDSRPAFQVDSFYDVLTGKISPQKYRDKIVLIGATATGVEGGKATPISAAMPSVLILAHTVSSLLKQDFFVEPTWGVWAEIGIFTAILLYVGLLLPAIKAGVGDVLSVFLLVALVAGHFVLMVGYGLWLHLMMPLVLLLIGHLLITAKHFLEAEKSKIKSDAESAASNRMLGLAFQGQGQLDMAFDKFRKVPLDDSLMDVLYNLGLDYERKRQFNKAEAVFNYMSEYNPNYRDLGARTAQTRAMSETIVLGAGAGKGAGGTIILDKAGLSKPMLGRYELEKELGKGAMGVVYMGRDPKIGRTVAIKTLALSQEFEADELEDVKERFFREAESAGRLNHPNIVTMYDAGEEHDLAYIAMELLKGKDLVSYARVGTLLPLPTVLSIVARVADALDYAHKEKVVHRDIKPANIMYDPEADTVKVTDFGIARITDSSKTKTGLVLGSPSYMSPEQLSGAKVDGQADLFSLGASLYQLVCGKLPFEGESMAQLMFRITNEPHRNILEIRPDVPQCVIDIINKALAKKVRGRYKTGAEMAEAIRKCAASLESK